MGFIKKDDISCYQELETGKLYCIEGISDQDNGHEIGLSSLKAISEDDLEYMKKDQNLDEGYLFCDGCGRFFV